MLLYAFYSNILIKSFNIKRYSNKYQQYLKVLKIYPYKYSKNACGINNILKSKYMLFRSIKCLVMMNSLLGFKQMWMKGTLKTNLLLLELEQVCFGERNVWAPNIPQ